MDQKEEMENCLELENDTEAEKDKDKNSKDDKKRDRKEKFKLYWSTSLSVFLNIILPTLDTILEVILCIKLLQHGRSVWAVCLFMWTLLNTVFLSITWKVGRFNRKLSRWWWLDVVMLTVQMWPQYRIMRIIWFNWNKDPAGQEEQKIYDEEISGKEKLIENLPQVVGKIAILALSWFSTNPARTETFLELFVDIKILFFVTLFISMFSCILSITTFFLEGKFRFIPKSSLFHPFFTINFFTTFIIVAFSFFYKVWVLGALLFSTNRIVEWFSLYNPPVFDITASCNHIFIVESQDDGSFFERYLERSNKTTIRADDTVEYILKGKRVVWKESMQQWVMSTQDCLNDGKDCSPAINKKARAYCDDVFTTSGVFQWAMLALWWNLVLIPQILIIVSCLAYTNLLSEVFFSFELLIASCYSNFTFGPVSRGEKNKLVLHNLLTWVMIVVSLTGLVIGIVIMEHSYRDVDAVSISNFWLYGSHRPSDKVRLPVPPIYPLIAALLSASLTCWMINMNNWLPCSNVSILLLQPTVFKKNPEVDQKGKTTNID